MSTHSQQVDLVISGGGPLGCLLAYSLARAGFSLALIERNKPQKIFKGDRNFAITYASAKTLEKFSLWTELARTAEPIQHILVSQQHGRGTLHYHASEMSVGALGFMVNEKDLKQVLWQAVRKEKNIQILTEEEVVQHATDTHTISLELRSKKSLSARLWIGAEGRTSPMRKALCPHALSWAYGQSALSFIVEHTEPHDGRAFEHFTPFGPLAFLPLPRHRSAVVWSLKHQTAKDLLATPKKLLHALIHHFGWGLGHLSLEGDVAHYPLSLLLPWTQAKGRRLIIGDAAHTIHPVAGQGLNLGLRDVFVLTAHLTTLRTLGLDFGFEPYLKTYVKKRRFDHLSMASFTHGLVEGLERKLSAPFWTLGTSAVKAVPPLKRLITRHAMGLGIDPVLDAAALK